MDFKKQVKDLQIVTITKPRVYLKWSNTEKGRDKNDTYERIDDVYVRYVNIHNTNHSIIQGDTFFKTLEEMYHSALANER